MNNTKRRKVINIITNALRINFDHITPSPSLIKRLQINEFDLENIYAAMKNAFDNNLVLQHLHDLAQINDFIDVIDKSFILHRKL
jgi:hypothetical protein